MTSDTDATARIEANVDAIARAVPRRSDDPAVERLDAEVIRAIVGDVVEIVAEYVEPALGPPEGDQGQARREWSEDVGLSSARVRERHADDPAMRDVDDETVAAVIDATLDEIDARVRLVWVYGEEAGWFLTTADDEEWEEASAGWLLSTDEEA